MRKIAAVFLMLALITAVFVSCNKDKGDETTTPILTGATISSTPTATVDPVTTTQSANPTYILTTSPDKTVPWGETTRYDATTAPTTQPSTIIINIPSDFNTDPVSPSYSQAPTTVPTTPKPTQPTTTKPTTTKPTTTQPVVKKPVNVDANGNVGYHDEDGIITIAIDSSNWTSELVSKTEYLPISLNGSSTGKSVKCSLNGSLVGDTYEILVDVSSLGITSGTTVNIPFHAGFMETKTGTQYSNEFELNVTLNY